MIVERSHFIELSRCMTICNYPSTVNTQTHALEWQEVTAMDAFHHMHVENYGNPYGDIISYSM